MSNIIHPYFYKVNRSATSNIFEKMSGTKSHNLGFGQSPFPTPDFLKDNLKNNIDKNKYLPNQGILALRDEISQYYSQRDGHDISPEQVVIGNGSKQLIYSIFMILNCEIYIPKPCWVSYMDQLKILKKKYKSINTKYLEGFKINKDNIHKTILKKTDCNRLLVFNNPHNPTGIIYKDDEIKNLSNLLASENLFILSDEIYSELVYDNNYTSFAKYLPNQTIIVSSISKFLGSGGWRLGYIILPKKLICLVKIMNSIISQTFTNVSSPIQFACIGMLTHSKKETYLVKCRHILSNLVDYCVKLLTKTRLRYIKPEAGWYLYIDFSLKSDKLKQIGIISDKDLQNHLDKLGVIVLTSSSFGGFKTDMAIRCCLVDFDGQKALDNYSTNIDDKWIETYCSSVINGIKIIKNLAISL